MKEKNQQKQVSSLGRSGLADFFMVTNKKRERTQITKIRHGGGNASTECITVEYKGIP